MRFQLPKPLHGWRALVGEVGIIVIGVLIALGAEQVVEAFHWRGEVVQFRKAVDTEMADSLAAYRYRIEQEPCVQRRMGELHQWLDADRAGTAKSPAGDIGRPSLWTFRTSVWRSSSSDIMNHLSLATRETYASLYDQLENVDSELTEESEVWRKLNAFNGQARFSAEDRKQADELLYRARSVDELLTANYPILTADAAVLGIRPDFGERKKHITPPDPDFCRRLFPGA